MFTKPTQLREAASLRAYVVLDLESAVIDETGHKRYQDMERWTPNEAAPSRRGYKRSEDPLKTPRWPFQTIVTASAMTLVEQADGNVAIHNFVTLSQPDLDEAAIVKGLLKALSDAPTGAEIVTWAGMMHDIPMLVLAAMRHGLTLPPAWKWLAFGGGSPARHIDFARIMTGGLKMKPTHMAEVLASLDIPAKITLPAFAIARQIYAQQWDQVQEACEGDVISTALLLSRWRQLMDGRTNCEAAEDRLLRQIIDCRPDRSYTKALIARRAGKFSQKVLQAANDLAVLAPWLEVDVA